MKSVENISKLLVLKPDFIGFVFYKKSTRFVSDFPKLTIPGSTKKVGVFVNESIEKVLETVKTHKLNFVQLHGDETVAYCKKIAQENIPIIKAFSVHEAFDFSTTAAFAPFCVYFLFDTKGKNYGGNGKKFNWEILQKYTLNTPFLLSGGISKNDAEQIKNTHHKALVGIDINSGFEIAPALKNITEIKAFKNNLV